MRENKSTFYSHYLSMACDLRVRTPKRSLWKLLMLRCGSAGFVRAGAAKGQAFEFKINRRMMNKRFDNIDYDFRPESYSDVSDPCHPGLSVADTTASRLN